jgi:hypothetical protein
MTLARITIRISAAFAMYLQSYLHVAPPTSRPYPYKPTYTNLTMEETDTESEPSIEQRPRTRTIYSKHPPLPYWIATGVVIGYACSAVMAIGGLNMHDLNVIYITSVFIPVRQEGIDPSLIHHLDPVHLLPSPTPSKVTHEPTLGKHPPPHPHPLPLAPPTGTPSLFCPIARSNELCDGQPLGWGVRGCVLYGGCSDVDCWMVVRWDTGMLLEYDWNEPNDRGFTDFEHRVRF